MEVGVLIPAYNEALCVARTVSALGRLPEVREIVVVDDGSDDATGEEASRAGAKVIRLGRNRGKAEAVFYGISFLHQPYLALVDADLGESASQIARLFPSLEGGLAAMAVAIFPRSSRPGGFGMVKGLARWAIRRCSGRWFEEPLSGQRVLRRELFECLRPLPPRGFGLEVALTVEFLSKGWPVVEVETGMHHRKRGRDLRSFLHHGRQCIAVLREIYLRRNLFLKGPG